MSLLDWVDSLQHVPVDESVAWRSCNWPFVNPSVVGIHHHHQVSVRNEWHNWIGLELSPLERIEESVNSFDHLVSNSFFGVVCRRKQDSESSVLDSVLACQRQMHSVHLELVSFSIDSMFWPWVKVELSSCESSWSSILNFSHHWIESLQVLPGIIDKNFTCIASPVNWNFTFLVCIQFIESVFTRIDSYPAVWPKVDWALVRASTLVICQLKCRPVSSPFIVAPNYFCCRCLC